LTREQRRLAAIVSADVAGYSRLMGRDESGTLAALKALRREVVDPPIAAHGGRIVKATGDGLLLEFPSVVDAVRCVVEVQTAMAERTAAIPDDKRIAFRVGVNIGDIIIDGDDIFGEGVNVAARLEALAEPGGACLSDDAFRQVRGKIDAGFIEMGAQSLKNIDQPVHAWRWSPDRTPVSPAPALALPDKPSIAVLPFQNMSGDPEQEYFVDGLVEDIITALSRFKSLFVIARNSSFTYKGKAVDIKQVGRELGVQYVLEGSVRKAGGRLRITGQLVDASTGTHIWADRYDGSLEDVFELQDNVATSVVGVIVPKLDAAELERAKRKPIENLDAYDCVLRARSLLFEFGKESTLQARDLLYRAMDLDPEYSTPYGLACRCISNIKLYRWNFDAARHEAEVRLLVDRIRVLGQDDAYALALAAFAVVWVCREHNLGMSFADRAVSVNPNLANAWLLRGGVAAFCGDHASALKSFEIAARISPIGNDFHAVNGYRALSHFFLGNYTEAITFSLASTSYLPNWLVPILARTAGEALVGRADEAAKSLVQLRALSPDLRLSTIEQTYPYRGSEDVARLREGLRIAGLPE